jgi:hypothetical protein
MANSRKKTKTANENTAAVAYCEEPPPPARILPSCAGLGAKWLDKNIRCCLHRTQAWLRNHQNTISMTVHGLSTLSLLMPMLISFGA